jgi:outer membrane immunogenic protein
MRHLSIAVIAAVSAIALTQIALAADIARPVYKAPPPAPPPPQDWSGVYVGLEGGYGWGKQSTNGISPGGCYGELDVCFLTGEPVEYLLSSFYFPDVPLPSVTQRGWLFGGFAGAQKQWGSLVLGIEADFDGADIKGSATSFATSNFTPAVSIELGPELASLHLAHSVLLESKIDELASVRGKVGWSFAPDWLIYGTGGAAFAHVKNTLTDTSSYQFSYIDGKTMQDSGTFSNILSGGDSLFGWAAGAGIDWKWRLDAGSALVFGVEYLHYGFPEQTITLADNNGTSFAFTAKENVDTVKGRISYLFSIH